MIKSSLLAFIALLAPSLAWAERPGDDWITMTKTEQILNAAGYKLITKIEADDGRWEGEGLKEDGLRYKFRVDPHSGEITRDQRDN